VLAARAVEPEPETKQVWVAGAADGAKNFCMVEPELELEIWVPVP